ncbi:hypothetical protein EJ08DRAFT_49619 [Tothia fuscella]|uniref:Uncharacterized protein n=1 Tax=Tothia fuscella TaxID=1048955 RepID=A0A9P4NFJ3_9PEZI|nr:hypothetical protein EJ08DRAFT_49619 [Tothia fuscella]
MLQKRQTPTILLLCRQITQKALCILHNIPLVFELQRSTYSHFHLQPPWPTEHGDWPFMSNDTLKQVREDHFIVDESLVEIEARICRWRHLIGMRKLWLWHSSLRNFSRLVIQVGKKKWVIEASCEDLIRSINLESHAMLVNC